MDEDIGIVSAPGIESVSVEPVAETSGFPWGTILRYGAVILLLAFLGFNLFGTLGQATESVKGFLAPLMGAIGTGTAETIKQTTNVSAEGAKGAVDIAAGTVDSAVDLLEKGVGKKGTTMNRIDNSSKASTQQALDKAVKEQQKSMAPEPDESGSSTQRSSVPKTGFCYIGEDRGFRSCIRVEQADQCMSGDIFPSMDICVNPNLRD
jgi:hypothetical protein